MSSIIGILLIISGGVTLITGKVTVALGVETQLESPIKYIVAFSEIFLGLYILYLNYNKQ
jgi:hypothetical protein